MILHWVIALALFFQIALGWRMEEMEKGLGQFTAFQLHKSVGISILLLSLLRLALRFLKPRPAALPDSKLNHALAAAVHWGFYLVMIGGPLTGWVLVSTAKVKLPTLLFGLVPWPHLPVPQSWHEVGEAGHGLLGWLTLALLALHVAGAIRHQFLLKEPLLERMMPLAKPGAGALVAALLALFGAHAAGWQWPFAIAPAAESAGAALADAATPSNTLADPDAPVSSEDEAANAMEAASNAADTAPDNGTADDAAPAQPLASWAVQPGGRLGFAASWNGSPVPGQFGQWSADIRFSPDDLAGSRIKAVIDLASVTTAEAQYADSLKGADFFNVAAHPRATFTSTRITHKGGDRYAAAGTLELHGVSRPATLAFTLTIKGDEADVRGSTRLDRTAFKVGSGEWAATDQIAGAVGVDFSFRAKRK